MMKTPRRVSPHSLPRTPVVELVPPHTAGVDIRRSEIRYRRLFQSAKDGILILDAATGKIIDANAFMSGLLGQELSELIGKELWEIGLLEDIAANKEAFRKLKETGYLRYDHLPVQNSNGHTTQVEFISNVYMEGDHQVAQCNVRDVTVRMMLEQQIAMQARALADQSRRKDEFLAILSHELRNPLASIRNAIHLLHPQERGSESPIQRQAHEVIERQVKHLTRLVGDLLDISRVITGRIELQVQTLDMSQVIRHAMEATQSILEKYHHRVSLTLPNEPVWVQGDPTRLEEIVVNLLSNAAKYTSETGRIDVRLERSDHQAHLHVRDSGVGIDAELLPRIFDLFTQADRTLGRSQGGLGIGLTLVQRLVELHGGTVEAFSEGLGRGSNFIVRFPVSPAPGTRPTVAAPEIVPPGTSMQILVVDDSVDTCMMLAHILRKKGHCVRTAHSGVDAIQVALAWPPEAVVLDIGLPGMDGYEVARRLRAEPSLKNIKLVAITGYGSENDIQRARKAGFDAHLLKPIELTDLDVLLATQAESQASSQP